MHIYVRIYKYIRRFKTRRFAQCTAGGSTAPAGGAKAKSTAGVSLTDKVAFDSLNPQPHTMNPEPGTRNPDPEP